MYKVIACKVFQPYIDMLDIDKEEYEFVYLEVRQHDRPSVLASNIQKEVDASKNFEKIIIVYGLCGGALLHIKARSIPLVLVKVHDCMSVLLGSKKAYEELTKENKSIAWTCYSLEEEGFVNDTMISDWQALYDEETIAYLKSMLVPKTQYYISLKHPKENLSDQKIQVIQGNISFLKDILTMQSSELLTLFVNEVVKQTADEEVIKKVKNEKEKLW